MENNEIDLDDDFETPRGSHSPISQSSGDCERPECDNDECAVQSNGNDIVHSSIDIESISIELGPNDPSTTVSTCSDDHKTNRNILSVQKEEAFDDWLSAKKISDKIKFSQIKELENHVEDIVNQRQENAKKAYAEWLEKKRNAAAKAAINRCESVTMTEPEVKTFVKDCPPHLAWLKKKNKIEQAKKQLMSSNQKAEESEKNNQKQISIEMYNKWLVQAKQRNKPVPFGQGLLSLKSCIGLTYTNTNEWISQ